MAVIGGGVIGLEMGSVYQRLGTEVTVIHPTDRVANFLDKELGVAFQRSLQKQGIKMMLNTRVLDGVNNKDKGVKINVEGKDGKK